MTANPDTAASHRSDRPAELPALTALRGLAALTVLFFHISSLTIIHAGGARGSALMWIWSRGYLAVDLFFLLSGFVLTHVYGSHFAAEKTWRGFGKFLWARFCRIYPASLFTTAVFVLAFTAGRLVAPPDVSLKAQLIANLTLMEVPWLDTILLNPPSWSISAEFYAYLLFPFLVPIILRLNSRVAVMLGVALLIEIVVGGRGFGHTDQTSGWGALFRSLPEFTAGILAYRFYHEQLFRKIWEKDATLIGVIAMIIAAGFAKASDGALVILLLALLLASVSNAGQLAEVFNTRPLRWFGEVSYSVYIFQTPPLMVAVGISPALVAHGFGTFWFAGVATLLSIGGGVLVHRCVDVPVRAALRRLPDRMLAFAGARQAAQIRAVPLASAAAPEQDR